MFKWMISGHKGHKHKQEKLNNSSVTNKNRNNLKQQVTEEQVRQQNNAALHITEATDSTYNTTTVNNHVNNNQQQAEQLSQQQQQNGDINQNLEKCDNIIPTNGLSGSVESDVPPPPPASRPPPPPLHPPPPVPPHGQPLPQPPQQPLPPVPGHRQEEHVYHQELPPQAPGTCTLPRRGIVREEPNGRYRSPSNPPPASRQPPPYSRHQPPDPLRRPRGPYQPPPPPKIDIREPRERDLRGLHGGRESRDTDHRDVRNSRNLEDTDPRDLRDPRERDSRDHWDGRDFRGSHDSRSHQDPKDVRDPRHFREIRECWERRNSGVPREDHLTSSALPRPQYESWTPQNNRWSTRDPDSGFDSLNSPAMDAGPRSLDSPSGRNGRPMTAAGIASADTPYSQSTEDLLNASRTSPVSMSSVTASTSSVSSSPVQYPTIRPAKQPCVTGASHSSPHPHCSPHPPSESPHGLGLPHHHSTPVGPQRSASPEGALLSDSVYPQHETQPRYAEIPDVIESRNKEDRLNHRLSRDLRDIRDVRDLRDGRDLRESRENKRDMRDFKDNREQRDMRNNSEPRSNKDTRTSRELRDTSLPRDLRDNRDSRVYMEVREERHVRDGETRGYRELSVDVEDHDVLESRQERLRGRRDSRQYAGERSEGGKEVRFSSDPSDGLRVRDAPSFDRRDRDADGADGLQVIEDRRGSSHTREGGQQDSRRGDGCTSSSVSWMEWTQQLQAYVAWVNSQLRKRGRPLISDLRRDLQSGVVFADLIEIISGERVAGITKETENSSSPQMMRENLERILQFMAAKRIRMTHITSKEVTEGNLKSIMRIILALAAHYKPQSVKSPPHHQDPASVASTTRSSSQPTTHDVGVGPDAPSSAPEKTPNLSANRRAIVMSGGGDDPGAMMGLRRHPSMTGAPATPRDSSPVYENLPRRVAPNRWAYDSLRASHKFQWSGPHAHRSGPPSVPPKSNLDESSDDPLNTSFNTSLNTSMEGEVEVSPGSRSNTRPAALNFWQDLTNRRDSVNTPPDSHPPPPPSQPPPDDPDNPFRYHTIHRMSGRRKLPQIPGAAGPGSRVTTPQEGKESPRGPEDSPLNRSDERPGGSVGDEGSREPEGRSQNSSPATSLVRGPTLDQWPREKNPLDPWEQEDLKGVLRDLNNTRDQLLALQNLLQSTTEVESRGVCTIRNTHTTITPNTSSINTPANQITTSLSSGKNSPTKTTHSKDSPARTSHNKDSPTKTSHTKEKTHRDAHIREDPNRENFSRKKSTREHQTGSKDSTCLRSRSGYSHKRHSRQELDPSSRGSHGPRPSDLVEATTASVKQELLHLSLARQALEAEKMELTRLLEQRESIITELRKQMHQRDKTIQAQRTQFEDVLRNVQNGKRVVGVGESPTGRAGVPATAREDLQLVRDAIVSLRSNFRETDPNQHTLDTLEQAIAILIERGSVGVGGSGGSGGGGGGGVSVNGSTDKTSRSGEKRPSVNGMVEASTKVIYFTERTVTPFMSTINKRLGEIRLRDFKNMFDRPGLFRFHFKSYDPEYGLVKEEIVSEDDILPGVDGKIIAWVEEDAD